MLRKLWMVLVLMSLLVLLVPACGGGDDEETPTVIPANTAMPVAMATLATTPTPTSSEPVKIGSITAWSGPAAMSGLSIGDTVIKLVEWQVKQQGGILGGREVKVVRYDNRASVPEAQAGTQKLYYDDKVSAIVWGGISTAEYEAVASVADELKILFVAFAQIENIAEKKFVVNSTTQREVARDLVLRLITKVLKPQAVAWLGDDTSQGRDHWSGMKGGIQEAGAKIVYEQFFPMGTTDFSPYLTKIKYEKPDVLYAWGGTNEFYISIAKQIMELGGWGAIKVIGTPAGESARKMPGAQGWYMFANYVKGLDYPGAVKFANEYKAVNGTDPTASHVYYYNALWTAINTVQLAGTDTDLVAIAQAARSGKLEWDTPMGRAHFGTDGTSGLNMVMEQIVENGNLVLVPVPE